MSKRAVILIALVLLPAAAAFAAEPGAEGNGTGVPTGGSSTGGGGAPTDATPTAEPEKGADLDEAISGIDAPTVLPEVLVRTPTRGLKPIFEVPRSTTLIPEETIKQYQPRHVVDVMTRRDPGIVMDMRTSSTGDPIMRGFAGFNLLTLVDGNSLSTLWGEGGDGADDMYGKVDPETIERVEVVRGPHSALYGSNALGGVINLITRSSPIDYQESGGDWGGRVSLSYASNMQGFHGRTETFGATKNLKFLVGATHNRSNDAKAGDDGGTLDPTRGKDVSWDFRTDWMFLEGNELTLSVTHMYRSDQHRYYRPTQDNKAERWAVNLGWTCEKLFRFMAPFTWRVYYQIKRDQRRSFNKPGTDDKTGLEFEKLEHGKARTVTWSTDMQASSKIVDGHELTYGLHAHTDIGESPDDEQFTITEPRPERAAAPDSHWSNYAAYLQYEGEVVPDIVTLTGSVRYDYFAFQSHHTDTYRPTLGDADETPIDPYPDFFRDTIDSVTGGLSVVVKPEEHWRIISSFSRGFRQWAPYFGLGQVGVGVRIPNGLLDPVTSNNYEVGFRARYPAFTAEGFAYYSDLDNWVDYKATTYGGEQGIDFDGDGEVALDKNERFVQAETVGGSYVWGFELNGTLHLGPLTGVGFLDGFSLWGGFAWNRGKTDDGDWIRHTQPARGIVALRWDDPDPERAAYVEFVAEIVDRFHRIPERRVDDDLAYRREPQPGHSDSGVLLRSYGGVPGYTVYSLYAGVKVLPEVRLTLAVENLTNKKYRRAHSRMDAFGINAIFGVEVTF